MAASLLERTPSLICPNSSNEAVEDKQAVLIVRSPFRAKHHVVVQYMAGWMKCPLPPPLNPPPPPPQTPHPQTPAAGPPPAEDKEDKEESTTLPARDKMNPLALPLPEAFPQHQPLTQPLPVLTIMRKSEPTAGITNCFWYDEPEEIKINPVPVLDHHLLETPPCVSARYNTDQYCTDQ